VPNEVVKVAGGGTGATFTYPPIDIFRFLLQDGLDRKPAPMTTVPGCFPPPAPGGYTNFTIGIECDFTASPKEGHGVTIGVIVGGQIVRNLPQ
jgi:hypothetical protein